MPRQTSKPHVEALEALIALAQQDEDEWVSLLGAVLVGYPRTGQLAYDALPLLRTAESLAGLLPAASWAQSDQYSLTSCMVDVAAASEHFVADTSAVDTSKAWSHTVEARRVSPTPMAAANAGGPPAPGRASTAPAALQTSESNALDSALDNLAAVRHASAPKVMNKAQPKDKVAPNFLIPKAFTARSGGPSSSNNLPEEGDKGRRVFNLSGSMRAPKMKTLGEGEGKNIRQQESKAAEAVKEARAARMAAAKAQQEAKAAAAATAAAAAPGRGRGRGGRGGRGDGRGDQGQGALAGGAAAALASLLFDGEDAPYAHQPMGAPAPSDWQAGATQAGTGGGGGGFVAGVAGGVCPLPSAAAPAAAFDGAMVAEAGGGATYYQDRLRRWAYRCDAGGADLLRAMMDKAAPLLEELGARLAAVGGGVAGEGAQIYAQKPNLGARGVTWSQENYAHLGLQAEYLRLKSVQRFTETYAIMQRLHNVGGLAHLPSAGGWRVASLGGGPGFELLAVDAFCREHVPGPPPQLASLDLEPSWREHAEALGLTFSEWDVTDGAGLLRATPGWPKIDLAVISYVFYHYMSHDLCYDWLAAALRSGEVGAVLIVSRFENLSTQMRALEARGVRAITLMHQPQFSARRTDHRQLLLVSAAGPPPDAMPHAARMRMSYPNVPHEDNKVS